jgi:hypothetical protein
VQPFKGKGGQKPETKLQKKFIEQVTAKGWQVKVTHGSAYSAGWPDLFLFRRFYSAGTVWTPGDHRWVDMKILSKSGTIHLTPAQKKFWPILLANGQGVWIITEVSDKEYSLLFEPPNLITYMLLGKIT